MGWTTVADFRRTHCAVESYTRERVKSKTWIVTPLYWPELVAITRGRMPQVFVHDYCNRKKFRAACMEGLGTTNEVEAASLFSSLGSSERFISAYSPGLDKFG